MGAVLCLVVIGGAAALFFLGSIVKSGVEKVGPQVAKVPVTLDSANVSLFNGAGTLKGFVLGNPEGCKTPQAMKVDSIAVSIQPGSVFSKKAVVRSVRIDAPVITYEPALDGSNLGKILDNIKAATASTNTAGAKNDAPGKALQVDEFVLTGGQIHVVAPMLGGKEATLPLPEIRLANLGQGPEGITSAELMEKAFGEIVEAAAKAVAKSAVNIGGALTEGAKNATGEVQERAKKLGSGISDLLKKKTE